MKKIIILFCLFNLANLSFAQDTTWVQTFTFDSITTRRAVFEFPVELNSMRFEKVLMYHKLKCSPLTTADNYNCGEWDASTWSQVVDHTGEFDSIQMTGLSFEVNNQSPTTLNYLPWGYTQKDTYVKTEHQRTGATTTLNGIGMTADGVSYAPFNTNSKGGRFQMLITANELSTGGVIAGNIESLSLYVNSLSSNGQLMFPKISIKSTSLTDLTTFQTSGFTSVYDLSRYNGGSSSELTTGENEFVFYQPFSWNGTDNIIIEFYYENTLPSSSIISFDQASTTQNIVLNYSAKNGTLKFNGTNHALLELSDFDLGNEMTIMFWSKGNGVAGTQTSVLEAYDSLNTRIINIHFPWSDNNMYFDAGNVGTSYDRINKTMTTAEIDNNWNHWAFVKNAVTGEMKIYKNGVLWHFGTTLNRPLGKVHRLVLGSNWDQQWSWKGNLDEFQIYNVALPQTTIQAHYKEKTDNTHPNWNNLLAYYDFDEEKWAEDKSQNDFLVMPSERGMFDFTQIPVAGVEQVMERPLIRFGQGVVTGANTAVSTTEERLKEPQVVFEYTPDGRHFAISNAFVALEEGSENTYDITGTLTVSTPYTGTNTITNDTVRYYQEPFELVNNVEIGRYITPYGIQFDLGPNGFTWIYDVTDYQQYLKGSVDFIAGNLQELIDVKFAFVEGIPPRDVHSRQAIWSDFKSYTYANMDNDVVLSAKPITLSDTSEMFKIKTRMTGHGHYGNIYCCEWDSKDHQILVNGIPRFTWDIWEEDGCGENPNIGQGGTWPYAREGWCPGDMVKEYDHELTPFVNPGETVTLDYDIEDISPNDPGQGSGDYIAAFDLISYSAPNFQNDAAILDVLNPNSYEYYSKWNPTCSNPRVILQNGGALPLISCKIRIWVTYGNFIDYVWTGNLAFLQKEIVEIPITNQNFWFGANPTNGFYARVIEISGSNTLDEYHQNDEFKTKYTAPEVINGAFYVWMTTNNKANENKWRLIDQNGGVIFQRTSLMNTTDYKDTFDLVPGCYSLILEDSDDDGIGFWYSSQTEGETTGGFRVRKVGGTMLEIFPSDFGSYHRYDFSVGFGLGLEEELKDNELLVFPNPSIDKIRVELVGNVGNNAKVEVIDMNGRVVKHQSINCNNQTYAADFQVNDLQNGYYMVRVSGDNGSETTPFIKQ